MIRLRLILERGRAHPILGPVLLIALALMLAMVLVHAAHDGVDTATQVGAMCVALASFFSLAVLHRLRRHWQGARPWTPDERGPPTVPRPANLVPARIAASFSTPLRR